MSTTLNGRSKVRARGSARINLRVRPQTKAILMEAARAQDMKLTEFMIRASQAAAEMALAERTRFVLTPEKWRDFNAALDSPAKVIPALRKLFGQRSVLDPS